MEEGEVSCKDIAEIDKEISITKTDIKKYKLKLKQLEERLDELNAAKIKLCHSEGYAKKDEDTKSISSFIRGKRFLPSVPIRQFSESSPNDDCDKDFITRSSTTGLISSSVPQSPTIMDQNRIASTSMENLFVGKKISNRVKPIEKRFSTIDMSFLRKLTQYGKATEKKKQRSDKLLSASFSSQERNYDRNNLQTSTDELNSSIKSEDDKSLPKSEDSSRSSLQRSRAIYAKKKPSRKRTKRNDLLYEIGMGLKEKDVMISDSLSFASEDILMTDDEDEDLTSEKISLSDDATSYDDLDSSVTSSNQSKNIIPRSKSSVFNDSCYDDSLSQVSMYSEGESQKIGAIESFLNLERCYVEKLQVLVENFEQKLRYHTKDSVSLQDSINHMFHHPCYMLMLHKSFLTASLHRFRKQAMVPIIFGDLFLEMVNQFKVYIEYANDFPFIIDTVADIKLKYVQLKEMLEEIEKEVDITLSDLFHVPLRKVETYSHLIQNVRQHMASNNKEGIILEEAGYKLEEITNSIEEIMVDVRKRAKTYYKRELIFKGVMAGQNEKSVLKMRYLFLYNDVLICARIPKSREQASLYIPKWHLPLSDILLPLTNDAGKPIDTVQLKQLKVRIKELQKLLKEEEQQAARDLHKGAVSKRMRGFKKQRIKALRDLLHDKIEEYQLLHMRLPFKIISKRGKTYTMHVQDESERTEWLNQLQSQLNKVPVCTSNFSLTNVEISNLLMRYTKLRKNSSLINKLEVENDHDVIYDGVLIVQVICGSDLGEAGSKPDVYCTIEADCNGVMCKKTKTKVVKGTTTPIWDETLCIPAVACQFLRIHVYGKKQFQRPVEIGAQLLTLSNLDDNKKLDDNKPHALIVNLQPKGQVKLTIELLSQEMARQRKEEQHETFGVSLDKLALIEGQKIPSIIQCCFKEIESRGLTEEGIYRVPGVVGEIRRLKSAFDESTTSGEVLAAEAEINVVAGVVKQFFRELPKPLFPEEMYNDFTNLLESESSDDYRENMLLLFGDIPEPNISVLVRLIQHLQYIAEYRNKNRMDINNLALVFGPNVVRPPIELDSGDQSCQSLQFASMQQVGVLKYFCEVPLHRLKEIHGDDDSDQRPGSAPAIYSPTSDRNVPNIVRRVSAVSNSEMISEEDYSFSMYSPLTEDPLTDINTNQDPLTDTNTNQDPVTDINTNQIISEQFDFINRTIDTTTSSPSPLDDSAHVSTESSSTSAKSDVITNDTTSVVTNNEGDNNNNTHILSDKLSEKIENITLSELPETRKTL